MNNFDLEKRSFNKEKIKKRLHNWFEKHYEWEQHLLDWAVNYLRQNPLSNSETANLHPNREAIIEYFCSTRDPSGASEKVRRMMGAWRGEKHRFKKHVVHLTLSDDAYKTLQKACIGWRKKPGKLIEDLLIDLYHLEKVAHKEEQKLFKDKKKVIEERHQKKIKQLEDKHKLKVRIIEREIKTLKESLQDLKDLNDAVILDPPLEGIDSQLAIDYMEQASEIISKT